ncbi:MAG: hypothetical protein ACTHQQ_15110 [Solirubrobacteraceae bacterium]
MRTRDQTKRDVLTEHRALARPFTAAGARTFVREEGEWAAARSHQEESPQC